MFRRLRVPFDDLESFRREFETHIARGGLFVPTLERFEPRELVEVELELRFCGAAPLLQAEVVQQLRPGGGNLRGVALQLLEPAPQLRTRLEALTGLVRSDAVPARAGPQRRHERHDARLKTHLRSERRAESTYTVSLSESGALLPAGEDPLPIGDRVRLSLVHPRSGEQLEIDARVVRHDLRDGRVEHIAVEFASDLEQGSGRSFLDSSVAAAHARSLGRVEGDLAAMNAAALLQMLPSSAPEGTLLLHAPQPGRIGCVLFRGGALSLVSLGRLRGPKALCRLLAWQDGHFEYMPGIEPDEDRDETSPLSLPGALLEALQHHDELGNLDRSALPADAILERRHAPEAGGGKLESELLGLLERPRRVAELVDACPAYDVEVYRALLALLDAGALALRSAPQRA